ncbi:MAG: MFS transporter [Actinobacteria bacterium]|nr:MFS transporter [Actinomycetota bacterium]
MTRPSRSTERAENVHPRDDETLSFDPAGVDEIGVIPWPILLRRRLARRVGIDHRWAVLLVVLSGLFTVSFTITILVVSLQRIADDLDSSVSVVNWVITGPMLAFGVVGPAFGKAGDLWGHKRVFVLGLLLAGIFAGLTAIAWNAPSMIAFRITSAAAGSACGPSAMAYINRMFEPELRVKPLGYWSFVSAGAPVLGVVAGGPLVEAVGWRIIFIVQAPLCLIGVVVALWLLPGTDRLEGVRFDVKGTIALGLGATLLLAGVNQGPKWGWASPLSFACFGLGVLSLVWFVRIERRVADPLIVLSWLRTRNITWPVLSQSLTNFAYMGGFIVVPQLLEKGLDLSESRTGLLVIARPLTYSVFAPLAGFVTIRIGERIAGLAGAAAVVASMLCFALVGGDTSLWVVVVALALSGMGMGFASPALTSLTANAVGHSDLGVIGAMQQLMQQLGAVAGTVVLTTISVYGAQGNLGPYQHAFIAGGVVAALGGVAAWFVRSTPRTPG